MDYFAAWLFFFLEKNQAKKENTGPPSFLATFPPLEACFFALRVERAAGESSGTAAGGCNLSPSSDENTSLPTTHNPKVLLVISKEGERERQLSTALGGDRVARSVLLNHGGIF